MNKIVIIIISIIIGLTIAAGGIFFGKPILNKIKFEKTQNSIEKSALNEDEIKPMMVIESDAAMDSDKGIIVKELLEKEKSIAQTQIQSELKSIVSPRVKVTKKEIITADDNDMEKILHNVLPGGDAGLIYLTLRNMRSRGIDPLPFLEKFMATDMNDVDTRKNAVVALFMIGHDDVIASLKTVVKLDPDENVRSIGLFCLDFLTRGREIQFFKEIYDKDVSQKVREQAKSAWLSRNKDQ